MTTIQIKYRFENLPYLVMDINGDFYILEHVKNLRWYETKILSKKNNRIKYKGTHYTFNTLKNYRIIN